MKKSLLIIMSAVSLMSIAEAARADRGKLEGVTADDIYNSKPAVSTTMPTCVESPKAVESVAECPAKAKECPKAAASTCEAASAQNCLSCIKILPGISSEKTSAQNYTTQFGKNWVAIGGSVGRLGVSGNYSADFIQAGAILEGSANVISCAQDTFGLNIVVPITYNYASVGSKNDMHEISVPMYLRPYYRVVISEDLIITPYANCGIGLGYACDTTPYFTNNSFALLWAVGGGVEVSFMKDFSFTPKYLWLNSEEVSNNYLQIGSAELAWRFASNMTAIVEYSHYFYKMAHLDADVGTVKVRYEF